MPLDLTPEQEVLRDTTRRFLEAEAPLGVVRRLADDADGFDRAWWRRGAELGWTSMLVPESAGGGSVSGEGLVDLAVIAEEMGRLVAPGPLVPVNVVAAALARAALGTGEPGGGEPGGGGRAELLAGLLAGERVAAWCLAEPGRPWDAAGVQLSAAQDGDGWVIDGRKAPVEAAAQADAFLVTARTGDGLTQFLVPAGTPGVTVTPMEGIDLVRRHGEVRFDRVSLPGDSVVGEPGGAAGDVERQLEVALVLQNAETVGATDRAFALTVEYAFDRYSFGRPLASYQALKHRFADLKLWLEACHGTADASAAAVQAAADDAAELVSVAKAYIGDHAPEVVEDCVQLLGGIGVTWDHDIHLYLRRVTLNWAMYGTPEEHRERLATLLGMTPAARAG